jgi:rRNA maturation endonuclease Nob1
MTNPPTLHYWVCYRCANIWQGFHAEYCEICGDDRLAKYELDQAQEAQNFSDEIKWWDQKDHP